MKHPYPLWYPIYWLATWFHSGLAPKAPGTFGTLAAIPFAGLLYHALGLHGLGLATLFISLLGWWVSARYVQQSGREDPKEVVIDEVAGIWLTLYVVIALLPVENYHFASMLDFALKVTLPCFITFRFFDVLKPWPISWMDRHIKGGLGIMLDDLLAALFAVIIVLGLHYGVILA